MSELVKELGVPKNQHGDARGAAKAERAFYRQREKAAKRAKRREARERRPEPGDAQTELQKGTTRQPANSPTPSR
jgi:hypothetical protein